MKKILALVLALVMVLAVATAFAGTITVDNVKNGETYHAYKLLNYTKNGNAWSYYLTPAQYTSFGSVLEGIGFEFTASSDGTIYTLNETDMTADQITAALKNADLTNALQHVSKTASADGALTFDDNLEVGYWYVTSSLGALTSLQSYDEQALVVEKNTIPSEDKKQSATEGSGYTDNTLDFNIGDTVYYQVEITDGKGTDSAITLTDTMTDGLTYNDDAKVYFNNVEVTAGDDTFSVNHNSPASGFTIVFTAEYVEGLAENDVVTVKYSAVINENAVINSDANTNTATLEYEQQTQTDSVKLKTYDFIVYKTDGTNFLNGAEFKLYDAATGGNQILIADDGEGEYHKDDTADTTVTIDINSETGCHVRGLKPGTYYLEEVVVPAGYNKLAEREEVVITATQTTAVGVTVVNNTGTQLPSTGGIGTTIFYIVGGILLIGAAVILVARRKAHD
jgi:fimbrial isopeptide formation D2 family protein/LPXTG-motif cell wall-anchored protein